MHSNSTVFHTMKTNMSLNIITGTANNEAAEGAGPIIQACNGREDNNANDPPREDPSDHKEGFDDAEGLDTYM